MIINLWIYRIFKSLTGIPEYAIQQGKDEAGPGDFEIRAIPEDFTEKISRLAYRGNTIALHFEPPQDALVLGKKSYLCRPLSEQERNELLAAYGFLNS